MKSRSTRKDVSMKTQLYLWNKTGRISSKRYRRLVTL